MNRIAREQRRDNRFLLIAKMLAEAVELSRIPGTFSNELMQNVFYNVGGLSADEIKSKMLESLEKSTKVSPVAKQKFQTNIENMAGDKRRLIRYLTDIVLKGDELGMQKGLLPADLGK
jgi:hypothetical protein